jgi:LAS superfamily LD-carboxypeptidase LdcB
MISLDPRQKNLVIIFTAIIIAFLAFGGYRFWILYQKSLTQTVEITKLTEQLKIVTGNLASTTETLSFEQSKNLMFEDQINSISSTVGVLEKIKQTDPELLKKYSEVSFLNENYIPAQLSDINPQYAVEKDRVLKIQSGVLPHLNSLLAAAENRSISLKIISAYRSFGEQSTLKSSYKLTYGSGANKFSADQGYSEHQLGTTVDFTTAELGTAFGTFDKTTAFNWLADNAYRYGFVLSYPEKNTYFQFEPWHWRYVGVELASKLHQEGKYFYGISQREINGYIAQFFD